jgi:hypothetical protein
MLYGLQCIVGGEGFINISTWPSIPPLRLHQHSFIFLPFCSQKKKIPNMHLIQITLAISLAAAGVAQSTWPPSATLGNDLEGRQPVKGCKEKTDGDFTNRWRDVIQSEWVRSDSQLSQVVQALCSTSAELGSCTDDSVFKTCKYEAETQEYKVEYKASAADGNLVSCLEAAVSLRTSDRSRKGRAKKTLIRNPRPG